MSKSVTYLHTFSYVLLFLPLVLVTTQLNVQVYVIGGDGILEELQLAGFTAFGGPVSSAHLL